MTAIAPIVRTEGAHMTKTVLVTPAQVSAAKALVARYKKTGRPVPESFQLIADASAPPLSEAEEDPDLTVPVTPVGRGQDPG